MFPMMDPDKMKPMEEDEAVKKMASIGAIMEGTGDSFSEDDEEEDDDDDGEIRLSDLDFGF